MLLGQSRGVVERRARDEDALADESCVHWRDAARWLFEAWPVAALVKILDGDAELLPRGLHPVPLVLAAPAYVLDALRVQWQFGADMYGLPRRAAFADYVADLLRDAVEPTTVEMLRHDAEFMRAYELAEGDGDG